MDKEAQILNRVADQIQWHSITSRKNKKNFHACELITLISGALVYFINTLQIQDVYTVKIVSAIVGALVVIFTGAQKLYKFQEKWINYRNIAEELKREKQFFVADVGEYDQPEEEKLKAFTINTENILQYGKRIVLMQKKARPASEKPKS